MITRQDHFYNATPNPRTHTLTRMFWLGLITYTVGESSNVISYQALLLLLQFLKNVLDLKNRFLNIISTNNHLLATRSALFNRIITSLFHFIFKKRLFSFWGFKIREECSDLALELCRWLKKNHFDTIVLQKLKMILSLRSLSGVTGWCVVAEWSCWSCWWPFSIHFNSCIC